MEKGRSHFESVEGKPCVPKVEGQVGWRLTGLGLGIGSRVVFGFEYGFGFGLDFAFVVAPPFPFGPGVGVGGDLRFGNGQGDALLF